MEQMNLKYKGHTIGVIGAITKEKGEVLQGRADGIQESTNCSSLVRSTKNRPKHPSLAKSCSAIPSPPLLSCIVCSAHNSHVEKRLRLTVHAALLNRRFYLTVKAHDDGGDGEYVW